MANLLSTTVTGTINSSGNITAPTFVGSLSGNASTATSASNIDGVAFSNTGSNSATNADTIASNGISYYGSGVPNFTGNATDGALYSQAYSSSWQHQIAGDYRSGQIALRGKNNGAWQDWRTVLDSSNFGTYADAAGSAAAVNDRIDSDVLPAIPTVPTIVSSFTNDSNYIAKGSTVLSSASWTTATKFASVGELSQSAGNHALSIRSEVNNDAFMSFHIGSDYAVHFGLDGASNRLHVGGWSDGTGTQYQIFDTRDFSAADVGLGVTAHGWSDHGAVGYATQTWVGEQNYASDAAISTAIATVTLASLGYTGATNANYITNNNQLTNGAGYITSYVNTQYTAGTGLALSGTTFKLNGGEIPSGVNLNTYRTTGIYCQNSNADTNSGSNWPTNNAGILEVWNDDYGNGVHCTQRYSRYNTTDVYQRNYYNGTWTSWRNLTQDTNTTYSTSDFDAAGSAAAVDSRIDNEVIPSIPTDNAQLTNEAGYITGVATYNGGTGDGLVPGHTIPVADDQNYFLNGAGNWAVPPNDNTTYSVGDGGLTQKNFTTARAAIVDSFSRNSVSGSIGIGTTDVQNGMFVISNGGYAELKFLPSDATSKTRILSYNQFNGVYVGAAYDALDHVFRTSNTDRVVIDGNGLFVTGVVTASGDITAFSDARVKENIETIPNALEKVEALRGVTFNKIGEEKRSTGVIAQEVKEVLPEVIHENEEGMLSVAYGNITGVLIEAIKEQQKQIDELKAQLDGLTK